MQETMARVPEPGAGSLTDQKTIAGFAGAPIAAGTTRVAVEATAADPGGGLTYLASQLPELARTGAQLLVFAKPEVAAELAPILPQAQFRTVPPGLFRRVAFVQLRLPRLVRRWKADVLYCPGSIAPIVSRTPTVLCVQNPQLFSPPKVVGGPGETLRRLFAWCSLARAAQVVHLSASTADACRSTTALSAPTRVIHSGAPEWAAPAPAGEGSSGRRPFILSVSNLYPHKRIDRLIQAYLDSPELNVPFDLVLAGVPKGDDTYAELRRLADKAPRPGSVRFLGFVTGDELAQLYRRAAVCVSLSEKETFGLTPAEALCCGTPVVLSSLDVFREIFGPWAVFVGEDDTQIAPAVLRAIAAPPSPADVQALRDCYSWRRNGEQLSAVITSALASGAPSWRASLSRVRPRDVPALLRFLRAPVAADKKHELARTG